LFPREVFIVTKLAASTRTVVRFYNKRGTAEQWIKEGKQAARRRGFPATASAQPRYGYGHG
jgi:hypothetical protein